MVICGYIPPHFALANNKVTKGHHTGAEKHQVATVFLHLHATMHVLLFLHLAEPNIEHTSS